MSVITRKLGVLLAADDGAGAGSGTLLMGEGEGGTNPPEGGTTLPEGEEEVPEWIGSLSDDLKSSDVLKGYKTQDEAFKALIENEDKLKNAITPLTEKSTDEERAAYFTKLGRPEKEEGYELKVSDELPESLKPLVQGSIASLQKTLFEAGASKELASKIFSHYQTEAYKEDALWGALLNKQRADATETLKTDWADKYEEKLKGVQDFMTKFGTKELADELAVTGQGNNPELLKLISKLAPHFAEDTLISDGEGGSDEVNSDTHVLQLGQ